jgi:hypothetical protein
MNEPVENRALQALKDAAKREDADGIELALRIDLDGLTTDFVPVLVQLLGAPWHQRHEDIARTLQSLKDPRAVDALYHATFARYDYLAYDDFFGLVLLCYVLTSVFLPVTLAGWTGIKSSGGVASKSFPSSWSRWSRTSAGASGAKARRCMCKAC